VWAYEEGDRLVPELPARQIVPITFGFTAAVEGVYTIGVKMEGKDGKFLPYFVRLAPD
jgi:hypothetical protein